MRQLEQARLCEALGVAVGWRPVWASGVVHDPTRLADPGESSGVVGRSVVDHNVLDARAARRVVRKRVVRGPPAPPDRAALLGSLYCTRTRTSVSLHDSRQAPYAVIPLLRLCSGRGA